MCMCTLTGLVFCVLEVQHSSQTNVDGFTIVNLVLDYRRLASSALFANATTIRA